MRYFKHVRDAVPKPGQPAVPCRNDISKPCVITDADGRQRFRTKNCLPHTCPRGDSYETGSIPHEWALDSEGNVEDFELGDYHGGPKCVRCKHYFCRWCEPDITFGVCVVQDQTLM